MNAWPEKILAIQFKYLGDSVHLTPALRALRGHFSQAEIHLLVPAEVGPLMERLPFIDRLWAMPRRRGKAAFGETLPIIRALRREHFTRVVDFGGNDRGAILSLVSGGKNRVGWAKPGKLLGCHLFYQRRVICTRYDEHESFRLAQLLTPWEVPAPASLEPEIRADDALAGAAAAILPANQPILFHMAAGVLKNEWPVPHWAELHRLARADGWPVFFTTPAGAHGAELTAGLLKLAPDAVVLPPMPNLALFLAVLKRAVLLVAGDTGPLHFAAGLGVPTLSLFGHAPPSHTAPVGRRHRTIAVSGCTCVGRLPRCIRAVPCMAEIQPAQVLAALTEMRARK